MDVEGKIRDELLNNVVKKTFGRFYNLWKKEKEYHEQTIFFLLKNSYSKGIILKNLLGNEIINFSDQFEVRSQVSTNNKKFIDIMIELHEKENQNSKLYVIIELKALSDNHDGQLTEYFEFCKNKSQYEPKCFYVSLEGKAPISDKADNANIVKKYKCLSYQEFIANIDEGKLDDDILEDYVLTVRSLDIGYSFSPLELIHVYKVFFQEISKKLPNEYQIDIFCYATKDKSLEKYNKIDDITCLDNYYNGICYSLAVSHHGKTLTIERRWEKRDRGWESSMYYGIYKSDNLPFKKEDYELLLKHWNEINREILSSEEKNQKGLHLNKACWYKAQMITDWVMPDIDNKKLQEGITDIPSVAKWFSEDFSFLS